LRLKECLAGKYAGWAKERSDVPNGMYGMLGTLRFASTYN